MAEMKQMLVAGGDLRQLAAAEQLSKDYDVMVAGLENTPAEMQHGRRVQLPALTAGMVDVLVLPMPVTKDGMRLHAPYGAESITLTSLLPLVKSGGMVLGGMIPESACRMIEDAKLHLMDYGQDDGFAIRNAVPTAEATIMLAMEELPAVMQNLPCVILGGGRVSQALQQRLRALGADVTVAARRSSERAIAEGHGCHSVSFAMLPRLLPEMQLVINTVPAMVLPEALLHLLAPDSLTIDLASAAGGDGIGEKTATRRLRQGNISYTMRLSAAG